MGKVVLLPIGLGMIVALTYLFLWKSLPKEVKETGPTHTVLDLGDIFMPGLNIFVLLVLIENDRSKS